jgi:hypothetical protein
VAGVHGGHGLRRRRPFSSASVSCTPRQRRLHRPIKAERPSLARPAPRFVLARSPAPTEPPPPPSSIRRPWSPPEPTEDAVKLATFTALPGAGKPPVRRRYMGGRAGRPQPPAVVGLQPPPIAFRTGEHSLVLP